MCNQSVDAESLIEMIFTGLCGGSSAVTMISAMILAFCPTSDFNLVAALEKCKCKGLCFTMFNKLHHLNTQYNANGSQDGEVVTSL